MLEETKERHKRTCCELRWHVYEVLGERKIDCLELETSTEAKEEQIGRPCNRERDTTEPEAKHEEMVQPD